MIFTKTLCSSISKNAIESCFKNKNLSFREKKKILPLQEQEKNDFRITADVQNVTKNEDGQEPKFENYRMKQWFLMYKVKTTLFKSVSLY